MLDPSLTFYCLFFLLGFGASFLGATIGLGGGFIIVPLSNMLFGLNFKDSVFMGLCAVLVVSLYHNQRNRELLKANRRSLLELTVFSVVGGIIASSISGYASGPLLEKLFALCLIGFAIYYLTDRKAASDTLVRKPIGWAMRGIIFGTGLLAGFFGIGGGTLAVPSLNKLLGFSLQQATKLSFFFIFIASLSALVTQFQVRGDELKQMPPFLVIVLVVGVVSGAFISRRFVRLSNPGIKKLFSLALLAMGMARLLF